jgi:hypothetical protein
MYPRKVETNSQKIAVLKNVSTGPLADWSIIARSTASGFCLGAISCFTAGFAATEVAARGFDSDAAGETVPGNVARRII